MRNRPRLGEMLVQGGLITEEQLAQVLVEHKRAGMKLGEYLIQQNIVQEPRIIDLISKQLRIKRYHPDDYALDMSLANHLPAEMARRTKIVPMARERNLLLVATTDPLDINALDTVEDITNLEAEPVICAEHELNTLFGAMYGSYSGIGEMIEDFKEMKIDQPKEDEGIAVVSRSEDVEVRSLQDMAEEAPVIRLVNSILAQAIREKASDIHISPEKESVSIRFRVDGRLQEVPAPPKSMFLPVASRLKILSNMDIATTRIPQDGRFTINMEGREINVRASALPTIHGENVVLRLLDMSSGVYTLEQIGMAEEDQRKMEAVIHKPYGMILSTGPTGSGKSTSLYALLTAINKPDINIITVEDPVEYRVSKIRQVQLNRKAGMTFASGLRSILRQDPDVVMVGEIRDQETAQISVQAALTGHRLLSTVHTNDAAGAVTRLVDMGIEPFLVSSVLLVSFAQRLVRKVCPYCTEEYRPDSSMLRFWGLENVKDASFKRGGGCHQCRNTGFIGRTGVFEILLNDSLVQEMIMRRASAQEIADAAHKAGKMHTLKEDAIRKVLAGVTTLEEATSSVMV